MSPTKISLVAEPTTTLTGRALVDEVIDPEILVFQAWFSDPKHGGSKLTPMEWELLRSYLYQKLTGVI